MALRIGVDIGGTFTDLIAHDDETGAVLVAKGRTVAEAPDTGVTAVVREVVSPDGMKTCSAFLHGTTIGLNALLQRRGAVVRGGVFIRPRGTSHNRRVALLPSALKVPFGVLV